MMSYCNIKDVTIRVPSIADFLNIIQKYALTARREKCHEMVMRDENLCNLCFEDVQGIVTKNEED